MELSENLKSRPTKMKELKEEEMANETVIRSLLIELRPRLSSGNVLLQTTRPLSKIEVSSNSSHLFLSIVGIGWSGVVVLNGPPLFSFTPSGFRIDDNSITFSVVFEPLDKRVGSSTAQVLKMTQGVIKKSKVEFCVPDSPCRPKCHKCGFSLWEEWRTFDRILELPSTPLEEVMGEWFCHGHTDSHVLAPRSTDCYHDSLSTVVYLVNGTPGVVSCRKCQSWLGTVGKGNMCRLWGCTMKWEYEDGSPWLNLPESPKEAFLEAVKLTCLEEGALKPIVKLSIESQFSDQESHWLILFIINGDLKLLYPQGGSLEEAENFVECQHDNGPFGKLDVGWHALATGFLAEEDVKEVLKYWICHSEEIPFKVNMSSKLMKKVLFREEKGVSGMKQWLNHTDIVSVKVAAPMFTAGLTHLKHANQLLPHSLRCSEGFEVSYLAL